MLKIGIIREGKTPPDKRVPFSPKQAYLLSQKFNAKVQVQPSPIRSYSDQEYIDAGLELNEDLSQSDILFGVKEVNIADLIPEKTYLFFSHTIKEQPYNRDLIKAMVAKKISLVDYECLRDGEGNRIIGFGYFAGLVGAYNTIRAYGLRKKMFDLKPANLCYDKNEMFSELHRIDPGPLKLILTGAGRVAHGAIDILKELGFEEVQENDFQSVQNKKVYLALNYDEFYTLPGAERFDRNHFFAHSELYESRLSLFTPYADILISGHYWDGKSAPLFRFEDLQKPGWNIEVIGDITCDINGSIPTTIRPSSIQDPIYGIDKISFKECAAFDENAVTIMAVDNLPTELPRDASAYFGEELLNNVVPLFLKDNEAKTLEKATILKKGELTPYYAYLKNYVYGD